MPTTMSRSLSNDQKAIFLQLEELLGNKQDNIGWHHQVGCLLRRMLPETDGMHVAHGDKWFETLAVALGWTSAPLYKKLRLAAEFEPDQVKELRAWEKQGLMTWTRSCPL
jgi:hypothetical protein